MSTWPEGSRRERTSFGGLNRGELMSLVRSSGNETTEKRLVELLRVNKLSGWRRHQSLPGRPDFVWRQEKVAVFVDGCFWHGHACRNLSPKTNVEAWRDKIAKTQARDQKNGRVLRRQGWKVARVWECQLRKRPERCVMRIKRMLLDASHSQGTTAFPRQTRLKKAAGGRFNESK